MEHIPAKRLLIRSKDTGWFGTDYTMNLYRGAATGAYTATPAATATA